MLKNYAGYAPVLVLLIQYDKAVSPPWMVTTDLF